MLRRMLRLVTCHVFVLAFVVGRFVACFVGVNGCWFVGGLGWCAVCSVPLRY